MITPRQRHLLALSEDVTLRIFEPVGCPECKHTGFTGRIPVQEMISMNDTIRHAISHDRPQQEWIDSAEKDGYRPLSYDALIKAMNGLTTIDEVLRVKAQ